MVLRTTNQDHLRRCPVVAACLAHTIVHRGTCGIWGGPASRRRWRSLSAIWGAGERPACFPAEVASLRPVLGLTDATSQEHQRASQPGHGERTPAAAAHR
ncbi:MAG: hypothetical protein F2789_13210 [Actinobacteria bacterium]|nr:hypothetical protein [Actinomycetota bacterium]